MAKPDKIVIIVPPRSVNNGEIRFPDFVPNDNVVSSFTPDPFAGFANYFDAYSDITSVIDSFEPRDIAASLVNEYASFTDMGIEVLELQETDIEIDDSSVWLQPREYDIELDKE